MPALVYWDQWLSQCFTWDEVQQPATLFITDQQERQHVIQTLTLKQSFRRGPCGHKSRGEELLQAGGGLCSQQRCAKPPWHCSYTSQVCSSCTRGEGVQGQNHFDKLPTMAVYPSSLMKRAAELFVRSWITRTSPAEDTGVYELPPAQIYWSETSRVRVLGK